MSVVDNDSGPIEALYREVVLDHYRRPRNRRPLESPSGSALVHNPVCGDQVRVEVERDGDRIASVSARTRGCSIAVAAGSVMTELVQGQSLDRARQIHAILRELVEGARETDSELEPRLAAFAGVARFPSRRRCALLPWEALEQAAAEA